MRKSNYECVHQFVSEGKQVNYYVSNQTGISVVHVELDVPTVNGYFTLATEIHNDSGAPHTLEHLIFLGSKSYPFKGILDNLANRAFAQGTNAWTDTDHTAYTIETVGSDGFLRLLPIFVDHVLFPTLTPSGCYTEVHHVNGKGEDAGVVYSEMQGIENTGSSLINLKAQRMLYDPKSGYRSETGGLMDEIRKLSVDDIRDYHARYYVPQNLCLVITGHVETGKLLKTLDQVDDNILDQTEKQKLETAVAKKQWTRPWMNSPANNNFKQSTCEFLDFPEEDESMGEIQITWQGPPCTDYEQVAALDILGNYLSYSAVAPLQAQLAEIEDPLCTDIEFYTSDRLHSLISANLSSVPTEELESVETKFFKIMSSVQKDEFNMFRMQNIIEKERLKVLNSVETDPHGAFSSAVITDFIYGSRNGKSLEDSIDDIKYLDRLAAYTSDDWRAFMNRWFLAPPHLSLLGRPSAALARKLEREERERVAQQAAKLGESGLAELERKLKEVQDTNNLPIPDRIITDFSVPSVETINFINVRSGRAGSANDRGRVNDDVQSMLDKDAQSIGHEVPLFLHYDDIQSQFATVNLYLTTSTVDRDLLAYIPLYLSSFFLSPVTRNGDYMEYQDVVTQLEMDTISYSSSFGTGSGFNELLHFKIKVEAGKYDIAIAWLRDLLYHCHFEEDRIDVALSKAQNDMPCFKRDGETVASAIMQALLLDPEKSVARWANILEQSKFLDSLEEDLDRDPEGVIAKFESLRAQLLKPQNMRFSIISQVDRLEHPVSAWTQFLSPNTLGARSIALEPIPLTHAVLSKQGANPGGHCTLVSLPIESTFSQHVSTSFANFNHPDFPALIVLLSYLNAMEGLLWKYIRGSGLAYGADLRMEPESGLLSFTIYRSPDAHAAWSKAREIVEELRIGTLAIDGIMLDGAKSAIVFDFVSREASPGGAAQQSFVNQVMKEQPQSYRRDLLVKIKDVTVLDLKAMLEKYVSRLFDPQTSDTVCVGGAAKINEIYESFSKVYASVTKQSLDVFEKGM